MNSDAKCEYAAFRHFKAMILLVSVALLVLIFFFSLTVGKHPVGFIDSFLTVSNHLTGNVTNVDNDDVVWGLRLPKAFMIVAVGSTLAVGGAVMQTAMRNPLADPYMMGVSSGASLGVSVAIVFGVCIVPWATGDLAIVINAFVTAMIPVAAILFMSLKRSTSPDRLILSGVAVMFIFSATTTLLMVTSDSEKLSDIYSWRLGSFGTVSWDVLPIPIVVSTACITFLFLLHKDLDILMTGPKMSKTLGLNSKFLTLLTMTVVALMTATAVCFVGTIGFVGLVIPNMTRILAGSVSRDLLPISAVLGAAFLLICDSIARVSGNFGLPVGVITSLIGGPVFILILIKSHKNIW